METVGSGAMTCPRMFADGNKCIALMCDVEGGEGAGVESTEGSHIPAVHRGVLVCVSVGIFTHLLGAVFLQSTFHAVAQEPVVGSTSLPPDPLIPEITAKC